MGCAAALLLLLAAPDFEAVDFGTSAARRVRLLRHDHPAVRRRAALLLAHAPADEAIAGLAGALFDPSAGVRAAAASSLQSLGDERAVPFLARRAAEEPSPAVLTSMVVALGRCGRPYAARHVLPYLEHPRPEVRAAAAAALGHIGDAGQRDALWRALRYPGDDPGYVVRASALTAFVNLGWKADTARAIAELKESGGLRHWMPRAAMLSAAGAAGLEEELPWIREEIATSPDPRVVAAAAGALARLGHAEEILDLTGHADSAVRRAALVALQECGDPRALERARALVETDPDTDVRFEAALVLHYGDHPDADLYLVDALRARNPLYWITALAALERRHARSFGRDVEAWTAFLKGKARG